MSQTPHDSPYRDAPSPSSSFATPRHSSDRPARKPTSSSSSPRSRAKLDVAIATPPASGPRQSRRRRRSGSSAPPTALTSHPTSRTAYLETRLWLLAKHGPVCAYCGSRFSDSVMTLDHVAPRRGQTAFDRRDNLVLACPGCNTAKRDQAPMAFLLGARVRAHNLLRYGAHLSPMLVDLARSLASQSSAPAASTPEPDTRFAKWPDAVDPNEESPYLD